jgi:dolichol-phosphate mannosyltransferase|tara:strand:- start:488 stop:1216 length:729 start_codon:yes stop_codon:yes gene_type:complete
MGTSLLLSVVIPIFNERDNVTPLVEEINAALNGICDFEIIFVNDASTDDSLTILTELKQSFPFIRTVTHNKRSGQSAGLRTGVLAASGTLIATLDGDGQNDPADIPKLLERHESLSGSEFLMITGHRVDRKDTWAKRKASRAANAIRSILLKDNNPDTGCSLKLYDRALFLRLPYFDHMHRFLPALVKRENFRVEVVPVNHRHRAYGQSKYANIDRLLVGIPDLIGMMWLIKRSPNNLKSEE